jgi:hypothetical protein
LNKQRQAAGIVNHLSQGGLIEVVARHPFRHSFGPQKRANQFLTAVITLVNLGAEQQVGGSYLSALEP